MGLMGILFDHISPSILFIVSGVLAVLISYSIIHLSEFDSLNSSMKEPALKQELI